MQENILCNLRAKYSIVNSGETCLESIFSQFFGSELVSQIQPDFANAADSGLSQECSRIFPGFINFYTGCHLLDGRQKPGIDAEYPDPDA